MGLERALRAVAGNEPDKAYYEEWAGAFGLRTGRKWAASPPSLETL